MTNRTKYAVTWTAAILLGILILAALSFRKATLACDRFLGEQIIEMPRYSTRIAFFPENYLLSEHPIPSRLGWIVSYADASGTQSIGFLSDLKGNILASGIPVGVPAVAQLWSNRRAKDQAITKAVEAADKFIKPGMPYADIIATLGPPGLERTNDGVVWLSYNYGSPNTPGPFITNGIEIAFSNGIVTYHGYSYGKRH